MWKQGDILVWENDKQERIVWLITDNPIFGVVIHSDGLMLIGTRSDLLPMQDQLKKFEGTVHISQKINT